MTLLTQFCGDLRVHPGHYHSAAVHDRSAGVGTSLWCNGVGHGPRDLVHEPCDLPKPHTSHFHGKDRNKWCTGLGTYFGTGQQPPEEPEKLSYLEQLAKAVLEGRVYVEPRLDLPETIYYIYVNPER